MLDKKKGIILIICSVIVLIVSIVIAVVIPLCVPAGGRVNQKEVFVEDAINSEERIVIPVKMKNGYSTPSHQAFNSTLSIEDLCRLASEHNKNVKYQIVGNNAYLYKEVDGKIVARATLHKSDYYEDLNYVLENMYVNGIVFPTHLTEKFTREKITVQGEEYHWYAVSFMTIDTLTQWLSSFGIYTLEVKEEKGTIICRHSDGTSEITNKILFDGNLICIALSNSTNINK